jgi:hypothetical protein
MDKEYIIFECPHCKQIVQVLSKEFNCKIFRHGIYKINLKQIDPHLKKEECDRLKSEGLIYGCGKPFQLLISGNSFEVVVCGYI